LWNDYVSFLVFTGFRLDFLYSLKYSFYIRQINFWSIIISILLWHNLTYRKLIIIQLKFIVCSFIIHNWLRLRIWCASLIYTIYGPADGNFC
jgi:hypothetical protein